jgi:hypothetical protein
MPCLRYFAPGRNSGPEQEIAHGGSVRHPCRTRMSDRALTPVQRRRECLMRHQARSWHVVARARTSEMGVAPGTSAAASAGQSASDAPPRETSAMCATSEMCIHGHGHGKGIYVSAPGLIGGSTAGGRAGALVLFQVSSR